MGTAITALIFELSIKIGDDIIIHENQLVKKFKIDLEGVRSLLEKPTDASYGNTYINHTGSITQGMLWTPKSISIYHPQDNNEEKIIINFRIGLQKVAFHTIQPR